MAGRRVGGGWARPIPCIQSSPVGACGRQFCFSWPQLAGEAVKSPDGQSLKIVSGGGRGAVSGDFPTRVFSELVGAASLHEPSPGARTALSARSQLKRRADKAVRAPSLRRFMVPMRDLELVEALHDPALVPRGFGLRRQVRRDGALERTGVGESGVASDFPPQSRTSGRNSRHRLASA
jgi:hypothetical protein